MEKRSWFLKVWRNSPLRIHLDYDCFESYKIGREGDCRDFREAPEEIAAAEELRILDVTGIFG